MDPLNSKQASSLPSVHPVSPPPSLITRFRFGLRRFPLLHTPLRWLKQKALPQALRWAYEIPRNIIPRSMHFGLPRGCYSEHQLVCGKRPTVAGRVVLTDQGSPVLPDPSVMVLCKRKQHLEQPWPVFWSHRNHARLVGPGLVQINERKELCAEAVYGASRLRNDPACYYFATRVFTRLPGHWTSIVSKWVSTDKPQPYAHWLLDALPRLALLEEFPPDTRIVVPPHRLPYQMESLRLLGLLDRCRWTSEQHLLIDDYFFSSPTSMIVCYNPYAVAFLRSRFLPFTKDSPGTTARFFLRRTTYGRNIANEQEVLDFFHNSGWSIVDTARMDFLQQILLFAKAEAICAIHGSGLANMVWCPPGCKVLELFADSYLAGDQEWIAQCIKADYRFMIFPSDHKLNAVVDLPQLKRQLRGWGLS